MTALQQRTLQVAKRYMGASEDQGNNRGRIVAQFQLFIGRWVLGQPWCAAFATFVIHKAETELGVPPARQFIHSASSSEIYSWAKKHGRLLEKPEPGCVGLVPNGGNAGHSRPYEHTFLVHDVEAQGTRVLTIEGNWKNAVVWNRRTITGKRYAWVRIG